MPALPLVFALLVSCSLLGQNVSGRAQIALESQQARLILDLGGGAIAAFQFKDRPLNPLSWATPDEGDKAVRGFGHFLCLDRWGPASEAEAARGMPYHGEASNVRWQMESRRENGAVFSARLPKAGLAVKRFVQLSPTGAVFAVREEVTNEKDLGRMYNMVQHPTIAPPFLDENTIVDCNGGRGFAQNRPLPNPEEHFARWPEALNASGNPINLRQFRDNPEPNVVTYEVNGNLGWITAANPAQGVLIGYIWPGEDYPWVSHWRDVHDGKPAARGLEFGTTGLHQPYPVLARKGKIWDRPLFDYIDAGQTVTRSYLGFLLRIPKDFKGVATVELAQEKLKILDQQGHEVTVSLEGLPVFREQRQ